MNTTFVSNDRTKEIDSLIECIKEVNLNIMNIVNLFGVPDNIKGRLDDTLNEGIMAVVCVCAGNRSSAIAHELDAVAGKMVELLDDLTVYAGQATIRRKNNNLKN